ncbi:hypothetical protein [Oryza sativa Japonica Group]|uniref:Uncharacterized protein n=1 Tax=Oryza sativa subsp. japonica TaxID=39947 RepID=Q5JKL7_ORYSJ|nr:hypothetical protein [Oryza sativa Japonica Group]
MGSRRSTRTGTTSLKAPFPCGSHSGAELQEKAEVNDGGGKVMLDGVRRTLPLFLCVCLCLFTKNQGAQRQRRDESAISDLAGHGFEEEGYPVVDYESALQAAMSTTVR